MKKQVGIVVYDEDPSWTPEQVKEVEAWAQNVSDRILAAAEPEFQRMRDELIIFGTSVSYRPNLGAEKRG
jgi:hypothetical protein